MHGDNDNLVALDGKVLWSSMEIIDVPKRFGACFVGICKCFNEDCIVNAQMLLQGGDRMWGMCLDVDILNGALAQSVVEYIIEDNKAKLILPVDNVVLDMSKIKEIPRAPRFVYGEFVSPINHLDVKGRIDIIKWHYNMKACFYKIEVDGKRKSKRYFDKDLVRVTQ